MGNAPRLTSTRLEFFPFVEDDRDELLAVFQDEQVRRYLLDDMVVSGDWIDEEVGASRERFDRTGAGLWSIRLLDETPIVGFVGFRPFFDPPQLQLLYGLLPAHCGRGLATEAAERLCRHAFEELGFSEVLAATDLPNTASIGVLERLGMSRTHSTDDGAGTAFFRLSRDDLGER